MAANVVDLEHARADVPRIVHYYDTLPLPPENDRYNHRLSLLRNRALVHTFYSTAARISEVVALNRTNIDQGRARYATIIGKGNRARTLYFRDYALESIRAYLKSAPTAIGRCLSPIAATDSTPGFLPHQHTISLKSSACRRAARVTVGP